MRRTLVFAAGLFPVAMFCVAANALLPATHAGRAVADPAYTGPGDIVASATAWYGLRAYSAAVAATGTQKAINIRRASDSATEDILILPNGNLDTVSATNFCNATTCTLTRWYDQSGGGNDVTQAAAGSQPSLTLNCLGALPCVTFNGSTFLASSSFPSTSVPLSLSTVAIRTSGTAFTNVLGTIVGGGQGVGYGMAALNTASLNGALAITATATDNAWHAMQAVANGASSDVNVDGTRTTGSVGTVTASTVFGVGARQSTLSKLTGSIAEAGAWKSSFSSANETSLCHNQFQYWGTSVSC